MPIRRPDHGCHGYSSSRNSVLWAFSSLVVQHDQAARIAWIQAASTGGICSCLRRVASCATPTGSAGHASATASLKLTFHLDHSVGDNQSDLDYLPDSPWTARRHLEKRDREQIMCSGFPEVGLPLEPPDRLWRNHAYQICYYRSQGSF